MSLNTHNKQSLSLQQTLNWNPDFSKFKHQETFQTLQRARSLTFKLSKAKLVSTHTRKISTTPTRRLSNSSIDSDTFYSPISPTFGFSQSNSFNLQHSSSSHSLNRPPPSFNLVNQNVLGCSHVLLYSSKDPPNSLASSNLADISSHPESNAVNNSGKSFGSRPSPYSSSETSLSISPLSPCSQTSLNPSPPSSSITSSVDIPALSPSSMSIHPKSSPKLSPQLSFSHFKNKDLIPVPDEKQTYSTISYIWFWMIAGSSVVTWSIGGSLLDTGLSARLAIACLVVGSIIIGFLSFLNGWVGRVYHIGFTITARSEYGIYGSFIPVVLRLFVLIMWFSLQVYWGGQACRVLIGSIIPGFVNGSLKNEFSPSSHLQKNDLISTFIFLGIYILLILFVPPEKMQFPFALSFLAFCGTMVGLIAWSISRTHGNIGPLFYKSRPSHSTSTAWMVLQGITSVVGTWSGGSLSQSDWTRFAKTKHAPLLAQFVGAPIIIVLTSLVGIIVTSASGYTFGLDASAPHPWNPITLLAQIQHFYHDSPRSRAGVFFASLGIVASQVFMATILNSVSAALDMSALLPRYMNIRRGALIMAPIAVAVQPWQLSNSSGIFLVVLGGFGIFMVSAIGVSIASFYIRHKRILSLPDLYCSDSRSRYWYTYGFSIIGIVSFVFGFVFMIPGWVYTIKNAQIQRQVSAMLEKDNSANVSKLQQNMYNNGWTKIYSLGSLLGVAISFTSVLVLAYCARRTKKS